ncbi:MAG: adenylyltransferase/cytidyltransferase family protein [Clostridia bacterium]|nr:adenylyltransferase/cytidyltransferase family protein [Clostridia bacterium]
MQAFELGITVGRFQTLHNGHADMIGKALEICGKVGVLVGSSQESGTANNPFTYEMRESMLRKVFGDSIMICPLPDLGAGNNCKWGEYVIKNAVRNFGSIPDLLVSGKEDRRTGWFSGGKGLSVAELFIPKTVNISASEIRGFLISGDFESWKKFTPSPLWDLFDVQRETVLASASNKHTASI